MEIMVKKLFEITLNNKKFGIFLTDQHRRTFLEIDSLGYYHYPSLQDFILLNNAYNNFKQDIYYDIPQYSYQEKVRLAAGLVAVVTFFNLSLGSLKGYLVSKENDKVIVSGLQEADEKNPKFIKVNDINALDSVLKKSSLTKEDIHLAIDNNTNLNLKVKSIMHLLVDAISSNYPEADLRTFYLNSLDLRLKYCSSSEILENSKSAGMVAYYNSRNNEINIDYDANNGVYGHELSHLFRSIYKLLDGNIIYYNDDYKQGDFILETMTCEINSLVFPNFEDGYTVFRDITKFLSYCEPFTITNFLNEGVTSYIEKLKDKYPSIDLDYTFDLIDSIRETKTTFNTEIPLDANLCLLDNLFEMVKLSTTKNQTNPYEKFIAFAKLFKYTKNPNNLLAYLDKFDTYLESMGYKTINIKSKIESWGQINGFMYLDNKEIYPLKSVYINGENNNLDYTIIKDDQEVIINDGYMIQVAYDNLIIFETITALQYPDIIGTSTYWSHVLLDNDVINPEEIGQERYVYLNDEKISPQDLKKIYVQIGLDETGKLAFQISKNKGEKNNLINASSYVLLSDYLLLGYQNGEDISKYFNEYYLYLFVSKCPYLFSNILVTDEKIEIVPSYKLVLKENIDSGFGQVLYIMQTQVVVNDDGTFSIKCASFKDPHSLSLYTILQENGILNENVLAYTYTEDELNDIIQEYLTTHHLKL